MSILVNFEDTYGMADIAGQYFFQRFMEKEQNEEKYGDVLIRRSLSTQNIFRPRTIPSDIDTIIFVYDMDKQCISDNYDFLEPDSLAEKIKILKENFKDKELRFAPVAFSAETLCLHMIGKNQNDYSCIFSRANTAHLHYKILTDILSSIHPNKDDNRYWAKHGLNKRTFLTKRTRVYIDDLRDIKDVYNLLKELGFSKFNSALFQWISNGNVKDISSLLTGEQAIELQREYKKIFQDFLQSNDNTIILENTKYDLSYNYK